jgi:thiol peroxidase
MAQTHLRGTPVPTVGDLPEVGLPLDFSLTDATLTQKHPSDFPGKKVLNVFPSIDTAVCALSVRTFNEKAASLPGVTVLNISADLPFAQKRFCGAEGLSGVHTLSTFRSSFLQDAGLALAAGPMAGLAARAVFVLDADNRVIYRQLVDEIAKEPDYEAAIAALG